MLVVLEGCDGSGKTTLAEQLNEQALERGWRTKLLHKGPLDRDAWDEYVGGLYTEYPLEAQVQDQQLVICDRWHLGEMVYGPLYRNGSQLSHRTALTVNDTLRKMGAVNLILSPALEVINERLESRGEDFLQAEDRRYVWLMYEALGHLYRKDFNVVSCPPDADDVRVILDTAEVRTHRAEWRSEVS